LVCYKKNYSKKTGDEVYIDLGIYIFYFYFFLGIEIRSNEEDSYFWNSAFTVNTDELMLQKQMKFSCLGLNNISGICGSPGRRSKLRYVKYMQMYHTEKYILIQTIS
jgi:hypothetical protein